MAVNKVVLNTTDGEETLIDLTQDTVTADTLVAGVTAHGADGEAIVGTFDVHTTLAEHMADYDNPHQVTAAQVGARPDTWIPTAEDVGARPDTWVPTAAQVGAATSARYTATLSSGSWSGSAAPYSQTVTVSGLLSTDAPLLDIVQTGTESTDSARREAWGLITRAVANTNSLTVYASEKPSVNLPVQMLCVR